MHEYPNALPQNHAVGTDHDGYCTVCSDVCTEVHAKWAKVRATTIAAIELFPAPMIWPMLTGTSLYVGLGETMVPLSVPEGYPYLMKELVMLSNGEDE